MIGYIVQRLFAILAILVVMSMLIFGITQILPGNVAYVIAGQFATPDVVQAIEIKLGLNDPIYVQYGRWAYGILRGDLGQSLVMERPVAPIIADALGASAVLAACSFVFVATIGIALGVVAAVRRNKALDHGISIFTYVGISVPEFFWGIVLVIVFARYLGWLPPGGHTRYIAPVYPCCALLIGLVVQRIAESAAQSRLAFDWRNYQSLNYI